MALTPGSRLGVYEVIASIGVGGMGEVFRARDTKLDRDVALKVLPEAFAHDADRLARFTREAKTLAALNHPNIAQIHGFEENGGISALVMELVEGDDLSQRITRGAIPLEEALPIARQIAEALEAAHEQGIIHRDLKPANIKVRADGAVKVLDFGLAKATEARSAPVNSPTITSAAMVTGLGMILGTAAYMSPEQARGKLLGKQTDIWAFGCVLYEMLTGRSAFGGETISDTIAKLLEREPDWQPLSSTPTKIRDLLRRCLEKDQGRRLSDIAHARREIEGALTAQREHRRVIELPIAATLVVLMVMVLAGAWWYAPKSTPPALHEPVSVLIADLQNSTGDPTFDHTLEQTLRLALEGAGFINAYDRSRIRSTFGVSPPEKLDEVTAREIAAKQGLSVVLSGSVAAVSNGYDISVKATQTATGKPIVVVQNRASDKDHVLSTLTILAAAVREALGDQTPGSAQLLGMRGLSTASLDAVSHYATAVDTQATGKYEQARVSFLKAIEIDPHFGLAYQGLAAASRSLGRLQDSEKYASEALRYLDGMTERERFATRGTYYRMTGDYQQCVNEYRELIARYAADTVALNNLAVCRAKMRDMPGAVDAMRQAVQILPNRVTYRANLALFTNYAGDFATAERQVRGLTNPDSHGVAALALSQLGQGFLREAAESYVKLGTMDAWGASFAASGLGDIALYEGRFLDAIRIFEQGAGADLRRKDADHAAMKYAALAYVHVARRQMASAIATANEALANSRAVPIRFLTARVFVEAGAVDKAASLAAALASELAAEPRAYGKIVEGEIALRSGDARQAIRVLTDANAVIDTWLGHFSLGRAYLELGAYAQADSEFDRCINRRGEALSLLDEDPTYGYLPPVHYFIGRAREALKTAKFAESYREYLKIRGRSTEDPLVPEVRRRVE